MLLLSVIKLIKSQLLLSPNFSILLVLLYGLYTITFNGIGYVYAEELSGCDQQTLSLVDCPDLVARDGEQISRIDNNNKKGNIEEQIPSVIPFP
jgi:hypothetical protein